MRAEATEKLLDPTQVTAKEEADGKIHIDQQRRVQLSESGDSPEAVWIEVNGEKVLGFWRADQSGKPVGAVVLLHTQRQNPRWTGSPLRLHKYFPLHGWATFSIDLPTLTTSQIPSRKPSPTQPSDAGVVQPSSPTPDDETQVVHQESDPPTTIAVPDGVPPVNASSIADTRTIIQQRITAATQYLHQQGQYNVVLLSEGETAIWALEHLGHAEVPNAPGNSDSTRKAVVARAIRAVIMLDVRMPESLRAGELLGHLRYPEVPTLDVYTDLNLATQRAAKERKQSSIKAGYETYVQKRLPPAATVIDADRETNLAKTLRGFLQKHAQGEELE